MTSTIPSTLVHPIGPMLESKSLLISGVTNTDELQVPLTDTPQLAGDTLAVLTSEKREWLAGRYVSANWERAGAVGEGPRNHREGSFEDENVVLDVPGHGLRTPNGQYAMQPAVVAGYPCRGPHRIRREGCLAFSVVNPASLSGSGTLRLLPEKHDPRG